MYVFYSGALTDITYSLVLNKKNGIYTVWLYGDVDVHNVVGIEDGKEMVSDQSNF